MQGVGEVGAGSGGEGRGGGGEEEGEVKERRCMQEKREPYSVIWGRA